MSTYKTSRDAFSPKLFLGKTFIMFPESRLRSLKKNKDEDIFNRSQWWTTEFENHGIKYLTLPKNLCRHRDLTSDVTMFIVKIY